MSPSDLVKLEILSQLCNLFSIFIQIFQFLMLLEPSHKFRYCD